MGLPVAAVAEPQGPTVRIAAEMRRLFREAAAAPGGKVAQDSVVAAPDLQPERPPAELEALPEPVPARPSEAGRIPAAVLPARPMRLRRHGRRPLAIDAAELVSVGRPASALGLYHAFALHLAGDGRLFASVATVSMDGTSGVSAHVADEVVGHGCLGRLAAAVEPGIGLAVPPGGDDGNEFERAHAAATLRDVLRGELLDLIEAALAGRG